MKLTCSAIILKKFEGLEDYGIEIVDRIELIVPETQYNHSYMETKKIKWDI